MSRELEWLDFFWGAQVVKAAIVAYDTNRVVFSLLNGHTVTTSVDDFALRREMAQTHE